MNKEELKEYERKSYGMENIHKMLSYSLCTFVRLFSIIPGEEQPLSNSNSEDVMV